MSDNSKIEWCDASWNFLAGCSKISAACKNCYAIHHAHRLAANPNGKLAAKYIGTTRNDGKLNWTGEVNFDQNALLKPLTWTRPRRIFVNSMSDLWHESVSLEIIDKALAVMALCPQHIFQILTKRPNRMLDYLIHFPDVVEDRIWFEIRRLGKLLGKINDCLWDGKLPLKNVWLGVSIEDQKTADERIPYLLDTPAAIRFLSCEPLLDEIDLMAIQREPYVTRWDVLAGKRYANYQTEKTNKIDWVIAGGESGANARPCHPRLFRLLRDQCRAANVPFFFKQWGSWLHESQTTENLWAEKCAGKITEVCEHQSYGGYTYNVGKKRAGRTLDGEIYNEFPVEK